MINWTLKYHKMWAEKFIIMADIDGVITVDTGTKVVLMNSVAETLTGWAQTEAAGKPLQEVFTIFNENTRQPFEHFISTVFESEGTVGLARNTLLISKNGIGLSITGNGAPMQDNAGITIGLVFVFRNMTEQRKTQEKLLKIQKLESLGLLAGGIAHDLNNFLTAILGNIFLAKLELDPFLLPYQKLTIGEKAAIHAKELTSQLLNFSKEETPIKRVMSIVRLLKDSVIFALSGSNVQPEIHITDLLWSVNINEGQITQVIHNLVINAQQAMPNGGVFVMAAENLKINTKQSKQLKVKPGTFIKISCKDNGRGISKKHLDKIFDPYFTTKEAGSGLGLFIAYSIIRNLGGTITVDSEEGAGTTFDVYLPATLDVNPPEDTADEGIRFGTGRILILDDDQLIRDITGAMLEKLGYKVTYASTGEEAIEIYKKAMDFEMPFNAVIMDLILPGGISGTETLQKLLVFDPEVKALVSSGYSGDPVMTHHNTFGFKSCIAKPYRVQELSKALRKVLLG